jgi:hypothetical protein
LGNTTTVSYVFGTYDALGIAVTTTQPSPGGAAVETFNADGSQVFAHLVNVGNGLCRGNGLYG